MSELERYPSRTREPLPFVPRAEPTVWSRAAQGPLSEAELLSYDERGFVVLESFIARRSIEGLRLAASMYGAVTHGDEHIVREHGSDRIRSVFAVHRELEQFEALSFDAALVGVARQILADDVYVHQSRVNFKPAFVGEGFAWHSDFETWHHEDGLPRMRALSAIVFLTANLACNGALMVIPGSHRVFVPCVGLTPEQHYRRSVVRQEFGVPSPIAVESIASTLGVEVLVGSPGTVVFFDSNLLHASSNNLSPFDRANAFLVFNAVSNRPGADARMTRPSYLAERTTMPSERG